MARVVPLPRPGHGRPPVSALLAGLAVIALVVGVLAATGTLARVVAAIRGGNAESAAYDTTTVGRGNLSVSVTGTGPAAANINVPLSFKSSGKLTAIKVNVGDKVTKGQVLATLDSADLQISLEQAQANLAQAQANLAKLQAGPTQATIGVAQTAIDNAKGSTTDSQKALTSTETTTSKNVNAAQISVASAQASLNTAKAALAAAQDQEVKSLAADQTTIANDQKNLDATKAVQAVNQKLLLQQLEKSKTDLYAVQIARDQACGRANAGCESQNASVFSAQNALNIANTQLVSGQTQAAQSIGQSQATLDQARAQLANDKAKLDAAVVTAQLQVKQSELSLTAAQAGYEQALANAAQSIQSAKAQVNSANNAVQSAQASYNQTVAPAQVSDVAAAKAQVANAQAGVDSAQMNLDDANLVAPFAGTVAAVNGSLEQWVTGGAPGITSTSGGSTASATAIVTLFDLNSLQVTVQVNEADIAKVQVGDPVTFQVSAFPNKTFTGKVLTIQPAGTVASNVVSYNVACSIQSVDGASLYPGMTATATVITARRENVLLIPNTAISFAQSALAQRVVTRPPAVASPTARPSPTSANATAGTVFTLDGTTLVAKSVNLGVTGLSQTEVLSGLQEGEAIVVGQGTAIGGSTTGGSTGSRNVPRGGGLFGIGG
ncbi:MAG TPA: biotin/lipoyl-binding protein [Chloroflexota bacterium]|nr:biotin/lipoyl-binding protein [Chloroflexota bacterium]